MAEPPLQIHEVTPDDWRTHRDVRLEMLLDAPDAFWTTYDDVAGFDEAAWRERIARTTHFEARRGEDVLGSVGLWDDPHEDGTTATLVAMYVRPAARGQGVGELLVSAVLAEGRRRGRRRVELEVSSNNGAAMSLYVRMGFCDNGFRQPHPRNSSLEELGMQMLLDPGVPTTTSDLGG